MSELEGFIKHLESMVGNALYVWGAQGESVKSVFMRWVRSKETSVSNVTRVEKLLDVKLPKDLFTYDCSGLAVDWLIQNGLLSHDTTADGLYNLCKPIERSELKRGDWVFIANAKGVKTHIGYVVDDNLNVVESQGRDTGVVKHSVNVGSTNGKWTHYARPLKIFPELGNKKPSLCRIVKVTKPMMKGDDVLEIQKRVGHKNLSGWYGGGTAETVKKYQKANGLTADGIVGKATAESLGFNWIS